MTASDPVPNFTPRVNGFRFTIGTGRGHVFPHDQLELA